MVNQHYRWDFIGLSTDDKPTFESSPKVIDGSTFYESDTSKLYVWYQDQWYEKEDTGGGSSINVVQTTGDSTTDVMSQNAVTEALAEAGGGPTVVQTIGNSKTDVMSQNATMKIIFPLNETTNVRTNHIQIGANRLPSSSTQLAIAIGKCAQATSDYTTAIGAWGNLNGNQTQAIGYGATAVGSMSKALEMRATALGGGTASGKGSVALGSGSSASAQGEMNIGSTDTSYGYKSTNYRLLSGVYDGQSAHDAATYGQLNTRLGGLTVVSLTQSEYDALSTKDANTLYVIKAS